MEGATENRDINTTILQDDNKSIADTTKNNSTLNEEKMTVEEKLSTMKIYSDNDVTNLFDSVKKGDLNSVKQLIESGIPTDVENTDNLTPLLVAIKGNELAVATWLIERAANNDTNTNEGVTRTVAYDDIIKSLLDTGFEINGSDNRKNTLLHHAVLSNNGDLIRTLVKNGAKLEIGNWNGFLPLCLAAKKGHAIATEELIRCGADANLCTEKLNRDLMSLTIEDFKFQQAPLQWAFEHCNMDVIRILLDAGANVNEFSINGEPLIRAASNGHVKLAQMLLERGANVNGWHRIRFYQPLHEAARRGHLEMVQLLLKSGGKIDSTGWNGNQPLHKAAKGGHVEIVEFLIEQGADPNCKNTYGNAPLHIAAFGGFSAIVELLIKKGANVNIKDRRKRTPLTVAKEQKQDEIIKILREHGGR